MAPALRFLNRPRRGQGRLVLSGARWVRMDGAMQTHSKPHAFHGRLVMIGFGCIGQGVLPLLLRHIDMPPSRIQVIAADGAGAGLAKALGVALQVLPLTHENLREALTPCAGNGDFVLNLSVDVSSTALIALCQELGALYLDTCIEPWLGGYVDRNLPPAKRSNYALREAALALRGTSDDAPTAVLTHGANPGLVSHFVKQALLDIATDIGLPHEVPTQREDWARLAQRLHVRVIHIAERDTQVALPRKAAGEFVNTWSVDAFVSEASQPAELGWGSHERHFPADAARHAERFARGDLPAAPGRGDTRAHLDAAVRARNMRSSSRTANRSRSRTT